MYRISNLGRVYSVKRKAPNNGMCGGYCLKHRKWQNGYRFVALSNHGKGKQFSVHRLVAKAFVDNPNGYDEVNHKDGDKSNNNAENLEWCTRSQNNAHAVKNGLRDIGKMQSVAWEANRKPVIFSLEGKEIARFRSTKDAADMTGISRSSISACLNGRNRSCRGYEVKYAK